jgi:aryl-alcohol dehydrogenase-like predicted oxidoreductase
LSEEGAGVVVDTLNACLDSGVNYIDTAQAYGDGYSETLIGRVMKDRRDECVLASKAWFHLDAAGMEESVHGSLERLQTDHIDVLQIHGRISLRRTLTMSSTGAHSRRWSNSASRERSATSASPRKSPGL